MAAGDLEQHFAAKAAKLMFPDPGVFVSYWKAMDEPFAGSKLHGVRVASPNAIAIDYETPKGLRLELCVEFEPEDDCRILGIGNRLPGGGSTTAIEVAAARAVHVEVDGGPILEDTLARILAGEWAESRIARAAASPGASDNRLMICARSRFAEDELAAAYARGVRQYVILGAGLDSFAYRHPGEPHDPIRVFEVDHPRSQGWKRARLAACDIAVPTSLSFVPVDLEKDDLDDALANAGFEQRLPAVGAWLGVTYYLTRDVIDATLARLGGWAAGSSIVFDYFIPERQWDRFPWASEDMRGAARNVAASGEPWLSFLIPPEVDRLLRGHGFVDADHLNHERVLKEYLAGCSLAQRPSPFSWVVRAHLPS